MEVYGKVHLRLMKKVESLKGDKVLKAPVQHFKVPLSATTFEEKKVFIE